MNKENKELEIFDNEPGLKLHESKDDEPGEIKLHESKEYDPYDCYLTWHKVNEYGPMLSPLSEQDFYNLKDALKEYGTNFTPILEDENCDIIDGIARDFCLGQLEHEKVKVKRNTETVDTLTKKEKQDLRISLNANRRQLDGKQKRALMAECFKRYKGDITDSEVARMCGSTHKTAGDVKRELVTTGEIPHCPAPKGKDGRRQLRKKRKKQPTIVFSHSERQAEEVAEGLQYLKSRKASPGKAQTPLQIARAVRVEKAEQRREIVPPNFSVKDFILHHGDFREYPVDPDTIDLFLTDLPYRFADLELWRDAAAYAARALKPNGIFISLAGKMYLPTLHDYLREHLTYVWEGSIRLIGGGHFVAKYKMRSTKRPFVIYIKTEDQPYLIYCKGEYKPEKGLAESLDFRMKEPVDGDGREKDWGHPDQQNVKEQEYLVECFSNPGETVMDLCAGTFTTMVACHRQKRKFVGCEIEKKWVDVGKSRLADEIEKQKDTA